MRASDPLVERPYQDAFLRDYSAEHLLYEVEMLFGCAEIISRNATITAFTRGDAMIVTNLLVEGFGLHLRNVVDFVDSTNSRKTDVVAADFCNSGSWECARRKVPQTLREARRMADKQVAHLTTGRHKGNSASKSWPVDSLIEDVKQVLIMFQAMARTDALSPKVTDLITKKCTIRDSSA
jgi:hypothetical protein